MSTTGCTITGNTITTLTGSEFGHGIGIMGKCSRIDISHNNIHDIETNGIWLNDQITDCVVSGNRVLNCGKATPNIYDAIFFDPAGGQHNNIKISDNLINDDQVTKTTRHGINFKLNGNSVFNVWCHGNQVYNQLGNTINHDWSAGGRFRDDTRFYNNTGFNPRGKITTPFNETHSEVGIPKGSTSVYTFGSAPTPSKVYTCVISPVSITSNGGTKVSISIKEPGGTEMFSGATCQAIYIPMEWTITWGAFSVAPTVRVVGL